MKRDLTIDEELETLEGKVREMWDMRHAEAKSEQRIVKEKDLEKLLAKGWRYVNALNNGSGKVIVEKAS